MKRNIDIITQYNCSYEDVSFVYLYTYEMRAYRQKFLWNVGLYIKTSWLKKKYRLLRFTRQTKYDIQSNLH